MKRVALFLATNIAILVVLSVVVQLLGLEPVLADGGSRPRSIASRCSRMTFSGRYWSRWHART